MTLIQPGTPSGGCGACHECQGIHCLVSHPGHSCRTIRHQAIMDTLKALSVPDASVVEWQTRTCMEVTSGVHSPETQVGITSCIHCGEVAAVQELCQRDGDQPLPVPNDKPSCHVAAAAGIERRYGGQDITDKVFNDIDARLTLGLKRYGTALQPFNGRDALRDAYEELLDALAYAHQIRMESLALDVAYPQPYVVKLPDNEWELVHIRNLENAAMFLRRCMYKRDGR